MLYPCKPGLLIVTLALRLIVLSQCDMDADFDDRAGVQAFWEVSHTFAKVW